MQVRAIWFKMGCPIPRIMEEKKAIPIDEMGRVASEYSIQGWIKDEDWRSWGEGLNAEISVKIEDELLSDRIAIVREQLRQTKEVRNVAFESIKKGNFDTSASAVTAFFKASEAERGLMQLDKMIMDLEKKQTPDLQREFRELAERAGADTTDAEVIEEKEDE